MTRAVRSAEILGITLIYALCFAGIQAGLPFAPPLRMAGLRALVGGLALWIGMVVLRRPAFPPRTAWPWIVALGLVATTLGFGSMFLSAARTDAGIASVLGNTQPLIVPPLAAIFLGERMTRGKWVALVLGIVGVALIAAPEVGGWQAVQVQGSALALTASAGLAAASVLVKRVGDRIDVLALTAWQLLVGAGPLLAASMLFEGTRPTIWNGTLLGVLLFLALIGTALANATWYWLIRHDDVGRLSMTLFLVPVFGFAIAVVVLGESVSLIKGIGVAVTILGLGAVALERPRVPGR